MGYRAFNEKTTLRDAEESSLFTAAALEAHPQDAVKSLAGALVALLTTVDAIEATQRKARHAAIRAGARVRAADGSADDEVREFVKDVLAAVRQDRQAPLYVAFFKDTPTAVIELSLAPEVEEIDRWVSELAKESTPEALKSTWLTRWTAIVDQGRAALEERKAATAEGVEASAKGTRWIERADRTRRAIDGALTSYAAEHDLPRDFNDRFFPSPPGARGGKRWKTPDADPSATPT